MLIYSLLIIMVIGKYKREPHDFQVFPIAGGKRLVEMPSIIVIFVQKKYVLLMVAVIITTASDSG